MKKKDAYIIILSLILIGLSVGLVISKGKFNGKSSSQSLSSKTEKTIKAEEIKKDSLGKEELTKDNNIESKTEELEEQEEVKIEKHEEVVSKSAVLNNNSVNDQPVVQKAVVEEQPVQEVTQNVVIKEESVPKPKQVVSSEEQSSTEILEEKYGTKKIKETHYNNIKYDDGTNEKQFIYDNIYYDKSGYNASTSILLSEATSVASQNSGIYNEILGYVNNYRSEASVDALVLDNNLSIAATIRAMEMAYSGEAKDISHTRPNGTICFTVFDELGINYMTSAGENVASGQRSGSAVSSSWYNSPGHRQNMEDATFTKIGIGMYEIDGVKFWVQLFIG